MATDDYGKVQSATVHQLPGTTRKDGGEPPQGDQLEARVARLESDVDHIKTSMADVKTELRGLRSEARTDFRILFGALIAVALGLAGLMARGFGWL